MQSSTSKFRLYACTHVVTPTPSPHQSCVTASDCSSSYPRPVVVGRCDQSQRSCQTLPPADTPSRLLSLDRPELLQEVCGVCVCGGCVCVWRVCVCAGVCAGCVVCVRRVCVCSWFSKNLLIQHFFGALICHFSASDHGIAWYPWYRQIGKYFYLSNMKFYDAIWKVFF